MEARDPRNFSSADTGANLSLNSSIDPSRSERMISITFATQHSKSSLATP
jgi:hypothetical protein